MNRNRTQSIIFYKNGVFDHVIQEGKVPEYTKKHSRSKKKKSYDRRYF